MKKSEERRWRRVDRREGGEKKKKKGKGRGGG